MSSNSSLLQWLATFELNGKPAIELKKDAHYNLADGLVCAKILNQISPQYFKKEWLTGIEPIPPNGSWLKRVSNLKRILKQVHDYASDLQSPQFRLSSINQPDVTVIAQNFDPDQICRLIQLILFCAISCDRKQYYIEKISNLPTQVKHDIKEAIEELLITDNNDENITQQHNTSQSVNNLNDSESEGNATTNLGHRFMLNNSSASSVLTSPSRSSTYRSSGILRRDSSQTSVETPKRNESHLDNSSNLGFFSETPEDMKQRLSDALRVKDEKAQACHELELKLKQLQLEKDQLAYENERLLSDKNSNARQPYNSPSKLNDSRRQSRTIERDVSSTIDSKDIENRLKILEDDGSQNLILQQNRKLQGEVHRLKEELIKIETEKEDYRLKSNLLKEDLNKITLRHDDLRIKADQVKRLQDELDEQRQISEKVVSYESTIENLMKKNNELKKELKSIEEKNVSHIHKIVTLEEENNQLSIAINRVELYKKQLQEAQVKLSQETHRADKADVELTRLAEKYTAAKNENQKLYETTNQLMRGGGTSDIKQATGNISHPRNKSFESVNLDKSTKVKHTSAISEKALFEDDSQAEAQHSDTLNSVSTSILELKEKIARLEFENKLMQNKQNSKRETDHELLAGLLENANTKCSMLEVENRQSKKKVMFLESRLKDLTSNLHNGASTSGAILNDSSSDNTIALLNRVEELQRELFQKEQELSDSATKYKKNLQKAKDVIKTLNSNQSINSSLHPSCMSSTSSFNSSSLDENNMLKQQLKDKQEALIEMEREFHEFKRIKEVHERLIISAFYGLVSSEEKIKIYYSSTN